MTTITKETTQAKTVLGKLFVYGSFTWAQKSNPSTRNRGDGAIAR